MAKITIDGKMANVTLPDGTTVSAVIGTPSAEGKDVLGYVLLPVQDMSDSFLLKMEVGEIGPFEFCSGAGLGSPWLLGRQADATGDTIGKRVGISGIGWMTALANLLQHQSLKEEETPSEHVPS